MTGDVLLLIGGLAGATFAIRAFGLATGSIIQRSRFAWVLRDLPGILIVAVVASSLAHASLQSWIAAAVALLFAFYSNNVVLTMVGGLAAYAVVSNVM